MHHLKGRVGLRLLWKSPATLDVEEENDRQLCEAVLIAASTCSAGKINIVFFCASTSSSARKSSSIAPFACGLKS